MAQFRDVTTGVIHDIYEYSTSYRDGIAIYKYKGVQLRGQDDVPLEFIPKELNVDELPTFNSFASKSPRDRKAALTKRSQQHFQKHLKEQQMNLDGHTRKQH